MIALISFKEELIIEREEAKRLKLKYSECGRVGLDGDKLTDMSSYYYFEDELEKREDGKYYNDRGEEVSSYRLMKRPGKVLDWVKVNSSNHMVDLEWFASNCKHTFYIEEAIKTEEPSVANIQSLLSHIEEKTAAIDKTIDMMKQQTFNQKVNVHVGGGLIVTYNDLCLKENCCTDELQGELNKGWRIIAVCVQPDNRRPDYILGRYNPSLDIVGGAKR